MRGLITILICLVAIGVTAADKPKFESEPPLRVPCGLNDVVYDWDFAAGMQGFTTSTCDDQGMPVWEHGATSFIPDAPGNVWGTVLEGDYHTDTGEALVSPAFLVDAGSALMEIVHYYDAENLWDGGNVTVNGEVITPLVGYPGVINVPGDWYAWCVDFEWGFTGLESGWLTSCFDLSAYVGQTIQVAFEFGSDDQFVEAGWYLASVKIGSDLPVGSESTSWSGVKSLYR